MNQPSKVESKSQTVLVRITARQEVSYNQIIEMKVEEWNKLKATPENKIGDAIIDWLDLSDVNGEDIDGDTVDAVVVGNDGEPLKPADKYDGGTK